MSFTLGSLTLPTPVSFEREIIETRTVNLLFNGTTKRKIINRKEQYILQFMHLTQAEVGQILAEYELLAVRNFTVDDDNLNIAATAVHIDIKSRDYNTKGSGYREDITVILTEVI